MRVGTLPDHPGVERLHRTFADRDLDALQACWHPDIEYFAPGTTAKGRSERLAIEHTLLEAFPDASIEITGRWVDGDTVIERGRLTAVHGGTLRTAADALDASGRTVCSDYVGIFRFDGEQVTEQRMYFDRLGLVEQLSAIGDDA
jgi:ketosteroid isomerase-like protein